MPMSAAACLQVLTNARSEALRGTDLFTVIAKVTSAFLESRWSWPRKFTSVSKCSYVLLDPRALQLDPFELQQLTLELQLRLFGVGNAGEVTLAVFEGEMEETIRFSRLAPEDVKRLMDGERIDQFGLHGQLTKIGARSVDVLHSNEPQMAAEALDVEDAPEAAYRHNKVLFRGLYLAPKQQFIGSIASRYNPSDARLQSVLDGPRHYPLDPEIFDHETVTALRESIPDGDNFPGYLLLPLNYTALSRRSGRQRYVEFLRAMADWPREKVGAVLYDAPRTVQHHALADIKTAIEPYVGALNLCVADAGFELEMLDPNAVTTVTLCLSSADDDLQREASIKRFLRNRDLFREKSVWPMIGNVRTRHDLRICLQARAPMLYGPALTDKLQAPVGLLPFLAQGLPMAA